MTPSQEQERRTRGRQIQICGLMIPEEEDNPFFRTKEEEENGMDYNLVLCMS